MFKEHERFLAFVLLGAALMGLALMIYKWPLPDTTSNSGALQILNMIVGALIGAFGAATQALFRTKDMVQIDQPAKDPIPVDPV